MTVVEAREWCMDLGAVLSKIVNNLQQAHEELRRIEVFIDATNDHCVGEGQQRA